MFLKGGREQGEGAGSPTAFITHQPSMCQTLHWDPRIAGQPGDEEGLRTSTVDACAATAIFTPGTGKLPDYGTLTYFPPLSNLPKLTF